MCGCVRDCVSVSVCVCVCVCLWEEGRKRFLESSISFLCKKTMHKLSMAIISAPPFLSLPPLTLNLLPELRMPLALRTPPAAGAK